jgi:hypothetical protein
MPSATDERSKCGSSIILVRLRVLHVEDRCPAYVRYCFEEPMDAAIFRSRFEPRSEPFRLAG